MSWWERTHAGEDGFLVAYFCAEFGVSERLPIYSGGLGVLAGDHLKAASDLAVPLVAVGLFYGCGFFRQDLDETGWQVERYPELDPDDLGLRLEPAQIRVEIGDESVAVQVWRLDVGRVPLLLLDSDVPENSETARGITSALYVGDREHRLRQEIVLGVGGVRALEALGFAPTVFHMNEGHSALLALERARSLMERDNLPFAEAVERVRASSVFTTHTPVPAGNEAFEPELVARLVGGLAARCGLSGDELLSLGRKPGEEHLFGLTPLALRSSAHANGVSILHAGVSRAMWAAVFPGASPDEVPIQAITNGVHTPTWMSPELAALLRDAGARLDAGPGEQGWDRAHALAPAALWGAHTERKHALLELVRDRTGAVVDPDALTVAFARRFATYKRAGLLLSDPERLTRLLGGERPMQILLAGKAHPADDAGKELIRHLVAFARDPRSAGRVVFLPDYDMAVGRALVRGADVWLNTPTRLMEASGTSGMKAALNGVLNLSVLDGWWPEAYAPTLGWAVGAESASDDADAADLFRLLEDEVLRTYHERDADGLPQRWIEMMRASIATVGSQFDAKRMVAQYVDRMYLPAHRAARAVPVA